MKKVSTILLAVLIIISLSACSSLDKSREIDNNTEKAKNIEESVDNKPEKKSEESTKKSEETETSKNTEIPPEYTLKRNIELGWDDPLPESDVSYKFSFFEAVGNVGDQGSTQDITIPEVKNLFTKEEIENYFLMKVVEIKENEGFMLPNTHNIVYYLEYTDGTANDDNLWDGEPTVSIAVKAFANEQLARESFDMLKVETPEVALGVEVNIYNVFGIITLEILTYNNEILEISLDGMNNQHTLVQDFAKLVYERFVEQSK